eukprot:29630-Pelagococcus_subviridis.AAC.5
MFRRFISIFGPPRASPPSRAPPLTCSSILISASSVTLPPICPRCAACNSMFSSACAFSGFTIAILDRRSRAFGSMSDASAAPRCSAAASARSCCARCSSALAGIAAPCPDWPSSARRFSLIASSVGSWVGLGRGRRARRGIEGGRSAPMSSTVAIRSRASAVRGRRLAKRGPDPRRKNERARDRRSTPRGRIGGRRTTRGGRAREWTRHDDDAFSTVRGARACRGARQ